MYLWGNKTNKQNYIHFWYEFHIELDFFVSLILISLSVCVVYVLHLFNVKKKKKKEKNNVLFCLYSIIINIDSMCVCRLIKTSLTLFVSTLFFLLLFFFQQTKILIAINGKNSLLFLKFISKTKKKNKFNLVELFKQFKKITENNFNFEG